MAHILHGPRNTGTDHSSILAAVVLVAILCIFLATLFLSGPHELEHFAQGAYNCRPFIGPMPYC